MAVTKKEWHFKIWGIFFLSFLIACEESFIPDTSVEDTQIVVEGYIEASNQAPPVYVILTKSLPFFSEISQEQLEALFIHGASVAVFDGNQRVQLTELCLNDLPPSIREQAINQFNLDVDGINFNFCAYVDLNNQIKPQIGISYELTVQVDETQIRATTTIPEFVPLDTLWFVEPPGELEDTLAQMRCLIEDPAELNSFFRYFTKINEGAYQAPFPSVSDDRLFNGSSFEFPLPKAEARDVNPIELDSYGLYVRGDTVSVKWSVIDNVHFDFWNTLEFNVANQGPFSNYTIVSTNIEGGLGIWGGLSAYYYEMIVPEQ